MSVAVDLDDLPQPDNEEVTTMLVGKLLAAVEADDDVAVLAMTGRIRQIAGYEYTVELVKRVAAACAPRWSEAT